MKFEQFVAALAKKRWRVISMGQMPNGDWTLTAGNHNGIASKADFRVIMDATLQGAMDRVLEQAPDFTPPTWHANTPLPGMPNDLVRPRKGSKLTEQDMEMFE